MIDLNFPSNLDYYAHTFFLSPLIICYRSLNAFSRNASSPPFNTSIALLVVLLYVPGFMLDRIEYYIG